MKQVVVLLIVAMLCACTSTREMYTQEGNIVFAISCKLQSYQGCIEEAGELCGALGYKFVNADGSPAEPPTPPSAAPSQPVLSTPRGNNLDSSFVTAPPATTSTTQPTDPASQPVGFALRRKYFVRCHS